jgi:uncharacterized protein (DUF488 family)
MAMDFARAARMKSEPFPVYTAGHSTRDLPKFLDLLRSHQIRQVADVRTIPRSRKNPQYNMDAFSRALRAAGIRYIHLPELGGLRRPARDSINTGWRNRSFQGFADYMQRGEFEKAVRKLIKLASRCRTVIMCAEAVPWRCHRSLVADALVVRGVRVVHIFTAGRTQEHTLTPFARIEGLRITYPESPSDLQLTLPQSTGH